jgi:molecular chaperone DnaK
LVSPHRPGPRVLANDKRRPLCNMLLKVDGKAQPFRERLGLEVNIDENLVLTATAWSLNQKGSSVAEVHDLEFALATPGANSRWLKSNLLGTDGEDSPHESGDLSIRSNIAEREEHRLVPGEVMYRFNPFYFRVERNPPQIQVEERLYYEPCAICRCASNDPLCRCSSQTMSQHSTDGVLRA